MTSFIDYLYVREEEGMGASIPLAVSKAVGWFQQFAGIPEESRLMASVTVDLVVKELIKKLEARAAPIKRAPRWLMGFVGPLEEIVVTDTHPLNRRITAWLKLVKFWSALRFSDAANLKAEDVRVFDQKLTAILRKTKTTGAGKRVRELPVYIDPGAYVLRQDWLTAGYELVKTTWREGNEFVFNDGALGPGQTGMGQLKYFEASGASIEVFTVLTDYKGGRMIPEGWERFWSEHSERTTLPSALAALGVHKDERDLIGRWLPEGSNQYVRTYNAAVSRLQRRVAGVIRSGAAYEKFDEGSVLEELKDWMVSHWDMERDIAEKAVEAWKKGVRVFSRIKAGEEEASDAPTEINTPKSSDEGSHDSAVKAHMEEKKILERMGQEKEKKVRKFKNLDEERAGGYVVVYQRVGRGTLHRLGEGACWMAKKRSFVKSEVYQTCPEPEQNSTRCRLCWRDAAEDEEGSTSDSCDEMDLSDVRREDKMWSPAAYTGVGGAPMVPESRSGSGAPGEALREGRGGPLVYRCRTLGTVGPGTLPGREGEALPGDQPRWRNLPRSHRGSGYGC